MRRPPNRAPSGLVSLGSTNSIISDFDSLTGLGCRTASFGSIFFLFVLTFAIGCRRLAPPRNMLQRLTQQNESCLVIVMASGPDCILQRCVRLTLRLMHALLYHSIEPQEMLSMADESRAEALQDILKENPNDAFARYALGLEYSGSGDTEADRK